MVAQPNVEKLIRETKQYEFADGLRDLQMAVVWAAMGIVSWFVFDQPSVWFPFFIHLAGAVGNWARWTSMVLVFLPTFAACVVLTLTAYARRRWLWRESGMVKPLRRMMPRRVSLISAAIWLVGVFAGITLLRGGLVDDLFVLKMLVVASGWATGYSLAALGRHIGLPRYVWLGAIGGLAPTPALFLPLTFGQTWLACGLWWGLALAISGMTALRRRLLTLREAGSDG